MKIKNIVLILIRKVFATKKVAYEKRIIHPEREWLIGLLLFAVIVVSGGIMSVRTFISFQNIDVNDEVEGEPVARYNQTLVHTALTAYEQRRNAFTALQEQIPVLPIETSSSTEASEIEEENAGGEAVMAN